MPVPASLLDQDGTIPEYTMVRVRNIGDTDVIFKWNKARYRIPPGADIPVPWPAMVRHMGDPRTIDLPNSNNPRDKQRTYEFQRLANKYGVYSKHQRWNERIPKLEAYTLDGERIITVLDDPFGTQNTPETLAAEASMQNETIIRQMQQQIARLSAQLAEVTGGQDSTVLSGLPPLPDAPPSAPTPSEPSATGAESDAMMDSPHKITKTPGGSS